MQQLYALKTATVTELQDGPATLIEKADGVPLAILENNEVVGYLISPEVYSEIMEMVDDAVGDEDLSNITMEDIQAMMAGESKDT